MVKKEKRMLQLGKKDKRTNLEKEIDRTLELLQDPNISPEEYSDRIGYLDKLYKMKSYQSSNRISADTRAMIISNLAGIALILWYEKADVITTKALGFVTKGRV